MILPLLPQLAFAAAAGAVVAGLLHLRGHGPARAWSRWLMAAATALSAAAFLALVVLFVRAETTYQYVFLYTSTDVPLRYRVAGAWAGREGSMLMWSTYAGIVAVAVAWWHVRRGAGGTAARGPAEGRPAAGASRADAAAVDGTVSDAAAGDSGPADRALGADGRWPGKEAPGATASQPAVPGETGPASPGQAKSATSGEEAEAHAGRAPAGEGGPAGSAGAAGHDASATTHSAAWTELVLAAITAAFMGAVAFQGTFAATDDFLLRNRPGGNGLNPTLLNPFILIHPPLMFLAYALTAVPLAAVVADQVTGRQAWSRIGMVWARLDWLLYTAAMGLGGIWAYYTLGFGGYWAWDPVEVANLLPWLALTLFLHAQLHHRRHGRYAHLGPILGILPFLLTLFSTISTRSGLWVSVHAFTDPTGTFDPDAPSRLLMILEREPGMRFAVGLFLAVLATFLALWTRRVSLDTGLLPRAHRFVAGAFGALAVASALAPQAVLGLLLEAAVTVVPGRPGFGLLAITTAALLAAGAPLLMANEPARRQRLDMRLLGVVAITVLGTGLLVLFLWHVAAVNGWSSSVYRGRFPLLATPVVLGLIVFQSHALWRGQALWVAGGVFALASLAAVASGVTGFLLLLTGTLVAISIYRVTRVGRARGAVQWARGGLWLGALLNVLFWLNPPTVRLGISWQPVWPVQLFMGPLALLSLHLATRLLAGQARRAGAAHLLVGLLGAYYVAPLLALGSWMVHRRRRAPDGRGRAMHQAGLYGIHLAVAVALLGYTASTYLASEDEQALGPGQSIRLQGVQATLLEIDHEGRPRIERILPRLGVDGGTAHATPLLYWEAQTASHHPLPATARLWDRDVYFAVNAVCIDETGDCQDPQDWIDAYEAGTQLPAGLQVTQVELQAFSLPGIALVWGALALWLYFMGLVMAYGPERP